MDVSRPGCTRMHYVILRSHHMQKHKFGITCPGTLFMETAPGPLKHEKECRIVSRPGHSRIHYMTCRFHWMQKHMFSVMSPGALFVLSVWVPPKLEK
jgi:hypothetical protein